MTISTSEYRALLQAVGPLVALDPELESPAGRVLDDAVHHIEEYELATYGNSFGEELSSAQRAQVRKGAMVGAVPLFTDGDGVLSARACCTRTSDELASYVVQVSINDDGVTVVDAGVPPEAAYRTELITSDPRDNMPLFMLQLAHTIATLSAMASDMGQLP